MRNKILLAALCAVALLLFVGFRFEGRTQYEYKVQIFGTITEKKLNEFGAEGWELTATTTNGSGLGQVTVFYFKRPKQ